MKPKIQTGQVLALMEVWGGHLPAAALLWEDLCSLPLDWTDCGSSCQLKMLLPLLASMTTVRMRWEWVGAGASPQNRTSPCTTTEPFLGGRGDDGQPTSPLGASLEPHHAHINTPPKERSQVTPSDTFKHGSLRAATLGREHSPSQDPSGALCWATPSLQAKATLSICSPRAELPTHINLRTFARRKVS